jgi:beta-mannosidase
VTQINIEGTRRSFYATDNFFWLASGEERDIDLTVLWRDEDTRNNAVLTVGAWNSKTKRVPLR